MLFLLVYVITLFIAILVQFAIGPVEALAGARVLLMPTLAMFAALAFPYPIALGCFFAAGFLWDAATLPIMPEGHDLPLGWTIIAFAVLGTVAHGLRPLFLRGRWEIHCLASGLATSLYVLAEFLGLTAARQTGIEFPMTVAWRILGSGLLAMFLAPVYYLLMAQLAGPTGFELRLRKSAYE